MDLRAIDVHIPCEACGGHFLGGRQRCEAEFAALSGTAQRDSLRAARHRLVVDAYCLQHLDAFCASAKSFAAHLVGLCSGIEYGGSPEGYVAIQRWLNGTPHLEKPALQPAFGNVTLADVIVAPPGVQRDAAVSRWAHAVWHDYAFHHRLARVWLAQAMRNHRRTAYARKP